MNSASALVRLIERHGGEVRIQGDKLQLVRSRNVPPELIELAKAHRDSLLAYVEELTRVNAAAPLIEAYPTPVSARPDPFGHVEHAESSAPVANGHQWPGMAYTADMGEIELPDLTDVLIAGRVRRGLVWLRPELVKIYEDADRTSRNGYGT